VRRVALGAIAIAALLCGCGPGQAPATPAASSIHAAQATHEYPSRRPPAESVPSAAASPERAIRSFTLAYINWNASGVARDLRRLAAASAGQARSEMQLEAARAAGDYELRRGGIANRGSVESIAPMAERRGTFVVVTLERTTASSSAAYVGLRPAWHVALASVAPVAGGGWVVSAWQPES
jgi:hypothetical protein